jgi:hypothetical protein
LVCLYLYSFSTKSIAIYQTNVGVQLGRRVTP